MRFWTATVPTVVRERDGNKPPALQAPPFEASARPAPPDLPTSGPPRQRHPGSGLRLHPSRTHLVASLLFVVCALVLFRLSLFEGWTFVGDSDRLNTALNVRLFEVDAIHARGSVPTWSDDQFMGYSIVGLHWLLTAFTPIPYLLALLPSSQMYYALAVLAAGLLALAIGAAYWALGAYSTDPVSRVTGALLYGCGSYTIHKLTQLDIAFLALVATPVLLRLIRETRRDTAVKSLVLLMLCWGGLVLFTVLQELAYIGLFVGTYALFRTIRTRSLWPALVLGLAVSCGTLVGMPRVLTVAQEFPLVSRTTQNISYETAEALRYFGDGLVGRYPREQRIVRGNAINLHEGIQLLHSALAALAVIVAGLLARSWAMRLWSAGLVAVLSLALVNWWERGYTYLWAQVAFLGGTRDLFVVLFNGLVIGAPLLLLGWGLCRWMARTADRSPREFWLGQRADTTPEAISDAPFFMGFVVLGLACVLIPEGRTALYYAFMRMDLLHARLSVAMVLPLAALTTIFLARFLSAPVRARAGRWLVAGLVVGIGLWLLREAAAQWLVVNTGEVVNELRPRRLLTVEAARVATSLLVLLVATALLVRRARPEALMLAGAALASFIAVETVTAADFKLNGPQTTQQSVPFDSLNYMMTQPGLFNVPTPEQRAIVRDKVEGEQYRVLLQQDVDRFAAHPESHLATFWHLRLVEGYSTGLPRRLGALPWPQSAYSVRHLDFDATQLPPWRLLAALNVKYLLVVDRSLWYNPAPGSLQKPISEDRIEVIENPYPVTPRVFFAAEVAPAEILANGQALFPGDDGVRPAVADPYVGDPATRSVAEGLVDERDFPTEGAIDATFDGDRVEVRVEPSTEDRFLVLNEMYHPCWSAWVDGQATRIYPTNVVMRGILVPAGASTIELKYLPFLVTPYGVALLVAALTVSVLTWMTFRWCLSPYRASRMRAARLLWRAAR
jgi:hypothetical protein